MNRFDDLADALVEAPMGAALLARLEWQAGDAAMRGFASPPSTVGGVAVAVEMVRSMTLDELLDVVTCWAGDDVGPWRTDGPANVAAALHDAEARRPVAVALADRFGADLEAPMDRGAQQWWTTAVDASESSRRMAGSSSPAPRLGDFDHVYGAGQITFGGLWTVTDPSATLHAALVDSWEMFPGPIVRWRLPVRPEARVFEIHRPADWVRLVTDHPAVARSGQECWELPGPNQPATVLARLQASDGDDAPGNGGWFRCAPDVGGAVTGGAGWAPDPEATRPTLPAELAGSRSQHATRTSIRRHLVPDWGSVATEWDAVHLSWAGLLTTEGYVSDLPDGDVAMLRYWFSERTLWLTDVFGDPEPLGRATIDPAVAGRPEPAALDLRTDAETHDRELDRLRAFLGR